jgi:hypothetical protein
MQGAGFYKGAWRRAKNDGVVARAFDAGWLAGMAACYTGFAWDDVTGATAPSPNPSPLQGEGDQIQSQTPPLACWLSSPHRGGAGGEGLRQQPHHNWYYYPLSPRMAGPKGAEGGAWRWALSAARM